jgi:hypothetical protein
MSTESTLSRYRRTRAWRGAGVCVFVIAFTMVAAAQNGAKPSEEAGLFEGIARWFDETFSGAGKHVENFGYEAGVAAKTTVDNAKDAAGAVARIPAARVTSGHAKCTTAPNGAPDCVAAADALCKAKGFESGRSLDMTTAEVCPAKVLMSGRSAPGACKDETFVSRAFCQ